MNILISKSEDEHDDDSFYEDFDTFIQFELDDIGTFKHPKLKNPIYSVNSGGDGVFYSVVALDANGKPVEYYFVFGYIEDYIDVYKEKEIKEELNKLKSNEGFSDLFKKTSKINNIDELFNIKHPLFKVANYGKYSFPSGKFIMNRDCENPNISGNKPYSVPSSEFLITSVLLTCHKSQAPNIICTRFLFNNKSKPVEFKTLETFKVENEISLFDGNDNDYALLKNMPKELYNELAEEYNELVESAGSNISIKTQIDEMNIKNLKHSRVLNLGFAPTRVSLVQGFDENKKLVALYFTKFKIDTINDILNNPDKEKISYLTVRGEQE